MFLASVILSLWILPFQVDPDPTSSIASTLKYADEGNGAGYQANTLMMKVTQKNDRVEVAILKFVNKGDHNYRIRRPQTIILSKSDWDDEAQFASISADNLSLTSVSEGQWNVRVKHRRLNRYDLIVNPDYSPIRFSLSPQLDGQVPVVCDPPSALQEINQVLDKAEKEQVQRDQTKKENDPQAAKKQIVLEQLKVDLAWQSEILDETIERRKLRALLESKDVKAQQIVMHALLQAAATNPEFQTDPSRLDNLMLYNTLYGEFRTKSDKNNHRTLAHLFWATESIENRLKVSPKSPRRRARIQNIQDDYMSAIPKERWSLFNGRLSGVVLASKQYSSFNLGDGNLSQILTGDASRADPQIQVDVSDFIAAYRAGYIKVAKEPRPAITHYVSPESLTRYPDWWKNSDVFQVFKGKSSLPAVSRSDLGDARAKSLKSAEPKADESRIDPKWFEGGKEKW